MSEPDKVELLPDQVASYDQWNAASRDILLKLVASFMDISAQDKSDGLPEAFTVAELADSLCKDWDHDAMVSALTSAVQLIAAHSGPAPT